LKEGTRTGFRGWVTDQKKVERCSGFEGESDSTARGEANVGNGESLLVGEWKGDGPTLSRGKRKAAKAHVKVLDEGKGTISTTDSETGGAHEI